MHPYFKGTIHSLRLTHAVLLLEAGADMKYVQERLGNACIQITLSENILVEFWSDFGRTSIDNKLASMTKIIKTPDTNGVRGSQFLIHAHILFAFPRVNLCAEHIPLDLFRFNEVFCRMCA